MGLVVGALGGFLGIGGGIILIPALTEALGPDQHLYQAAAMIVYVFVAAPAVIQHRRAGLIVPGVVTRLCPASLVMVILGVALSELPLFSGDGEAWLRFLFGAFLAACGLYEIHRLRRSLRSGAHPDIELTQLCLRPNIRQSLLIAVPTGLYTGLLGVGGGIVSIPLQRRVLRMPLRNAIANSSAIMVVTCTAGALSKNYAYLRDNDGSMQSLVLAAVLIPSAIVGSLMGSRGTARLPIAWVRTALIAILLISGGRMLQGAIQSIRGFG